MTRIQQLNRALLRTLMKPETANIVADRLEELEAENAKLREAGDALAAIINTSVGAPVSQWPDDNQMDAAIAAWNAAKKTA
jgi:hypothetical protein